MREAKTRFLETKTPVLGVGCALGPKARPNEHLLEGVIAVETAVAEQQIDGALSLN